MRGKAVSVVGIALAMMMVVVVAVAPAYAASPAQQIGSMMAGVNNWHTLAPGQTAEWDFTYQAVVLNTSPQTFDHAIITLASNPQGAIGFKVYTNQEWMNLGNVSTTVTPSGEGTLTKVKNADGTTSVVNNGYLTWVTSSAAGMRYHIQVYSTSSQPAQYWIAASGGGDAGLVPYQATTVQPSTSAPAQPSGAAVQAQPSASPAQQTGKWQTLAPGQTAEWDLTYQAIALNTSPQTFDQAIVTLASNPQGAIGFRVYTNQEWMSRSNASTTVTPIGQGTLTIVKNSDGTTSVANNGYLTWVTSSAAGGLYHIQVYSVSSQPAQYWIAANGGGDVQLVPYQATTVQPSTSAPAQPSGAAVQAQTSASPAQQTGSMMAGVNNWHTLAPGQTAEWDLTYQAIALNTSPQTFDQAIITLASNPQGAIGFRVYTNQEWMNLSNVSTTVTPSGEGTLTKVKNADGTTSVVNNGYLTWVTSSAAGMRYHIQVYSTSSQPAQYWIAASGAGDAGLAPY